jgi:hypothetical protein
MRKGPFFTDLFLDISAHVGWRGGKGEVDTVYQPLLGGE